MSRSTKLTWSRFRGKNDKFITSFTQEPVGQKHISFTLGELELLTQTFKQLAYKVYIVFQKNFPYAWSAELFF